VTYCCGNIIQGGPKSGTISYGAIVQVHVTAP